MQRNLHSFQEMNVGSFSRDTILNITVMSDILIVPAEWRDFAGSELLFLHRTMYLAASEFVVGTDSVSEFEFQSESAFDFRAAFPALLPLLRHPLRQRLLRSAFAFVSAIVFGLPVLPEAAEEFV